MPGSTSIYDQRLFTANKARECAGVNEAANSIVIASDGHDLSVETPAGDVRAFGM